MKRHKPRAITDKEFKRLFPEDKIHMVMDNICDVCGAIRRTPFARGKQGVWEKDNQPQPLCEGKQNEN